VHPRALRHETARPRTEGPPSATVSGGPGSAGVLKRWHGAGNGASARREQWSDTPWPFGARCAQISQAYQSDLGPNGRDRTHDQVPETEPTDGRAKELT
jgi:hypothetical protein